MSTPRYGHAPILMNQVLNSDCVKQIGDFCLSSNQSHIGMAIPSPNTGEGATEEGWTFVYLPIATGPKQANKWEWDGKENAPTLSPSVHTHGHWHGWVRNGFLVEA